MSSAFPRKRFPRSARVRTRAEYSTVFNGARRVSDPLMTLHWLKGDAPARLGMAVSRKVDTRAVGRNRIKRVLRDATRHLLPCLAGGDFVVVARSAAKTASNQQIREAFERLLRRAGALPAAGADGTMPPRKGAEPTPLNAPDASSGRAEPAC
ncbi:ribonuclease P protein component [Stenotrophomonas sp. MH1]|uniref:Ribonuclease P protein component n=1 Tax=Stenotrophomonas capsici TaxID=3110230 RepID=A0ABU5V4F0_9GAMM|nr:MULTISPECIES: ribonuclease P protein component [unclassified Stenotrophomonas]MBD9536161.1 ribonuclease P protein component [Stenotrophomonas sp. STM01]MEA5667733.1 ribonuclease P protein component [Stenotrophomonas sp. MH1]